MIRVEGEGRLDEVFERDKRCIETSQRYNCPRLPNPPILRHYDHFDSSAIRSLEGSLFYDCGGSLSPFGILLTARSYYTYSRLHWKGARNVFDQDLPNGMLVVHSSGCGVSLFRQSALGVSTVISSSRHLQDTSPYIQGSYRFQRLAAQTSYIYKAQQI